MSPTARSDGRQHRGKRVNLDRGLHALKDLDPVLRRGAWIALCDFSGEVVSALLSISSGKLAVRTTTRQIERLVVFLTEVTRRPNARPQLRPIAPYLLNRDTRHFRPRPYATARRMSLGQIRSRRTL